MAILVTVGPKQVREGIRALGDFVSAHEDGTVLGDGYANFVLVEVPKVSVKKVMSALIALLPETRYIEMPVSERKRLDWKDSGKWYEVKKTPLYNWNISDIKGNDLNILTGESSTEAEKEMVLAKVKRNVAELSVNKENEIKVVVRG